MTAHDRILTLDNLMLRGHPLANRCCMCRCNGEFVDHLLIHCHVANSLWVFMLQAFGIQWVLPSFVAELLFCWNHWLGKHDSDIWNLIPGCLMWTVWMEGNRRSFEDSEKSSVELTCLCQRSLFDWSRCWVLQNVLLLFRFFLLLVQSLDCFLWCSVLCFAVFILINTLYVSFSIFKIGRAHV